MGKGRVRELVQGFQRNEKTKPFLPVAGKAQLPGWKMGFEPTTHGTTIRYSNQLSYIHRFWGAK